MKATWEIRGRKSSFHHLKVSFFLHLNGVILLSSLAASNNSWIETWWTLFIAVESESDLTQIQQIITFKKRLESIEGMRRCSNFSNSETKNNRRHQVPPTETQVQLTGWLLVFDSDSLVLLLEYLYVLHNTKLLPNWKVHTLRLPYDY